MAQVARAQIYQPEGLGNLAVSQPSCFLPVAWQLDTERLLQHLTRSVDWRVARGLAVVNQIQPACLDDEKGKKYSRNTRTDNSTSISQADVLFLPQSTCQKKSPAFLQKRPKAVAFHRAQINVNALCPDSSVADEPSGMTQQHQHRQQPLSPSMGTVNTITVTTCPSSRWSRATPNQTQTHPLSPNRTTPISEPSRKAMQTSLLETAKLLLSESSKLEPVPLGEWFNDPVILCVLT
ncbi:hypothetical protein T265_02307 [Opisthorchis viverrini]|uniref:Uncharacterized protein n=1 Tax=Opisthorchis viverrini TaxID=6198 RepID=A0A074ZW79_OPIVI|nr:hypothetical protein T265_02307 [Opisthorchis viverrini]KER31386.1 hypothetical protein T265_02307 [Opisthorchis viverrini]